MGKLNSLKAKFAGTVNDIALSAYDAKQKTISPVNKAMVYGMTAVMLVSMFAIGASASGLGDITTSATTALNNVLNSISTILDITAAVCAGIALMFLIFSKNQRAVESAKEWLKRIAIGLVAWHGLGLIFSFLTSLTPGGDIQSKL